MRNITLALILISFLVFPAAEVIAFDLGAHCRGLKSEEACIEVEIPDDKACFWHENVALADYPCRTYVPAPDVELIYGIGLIGNIIFTILMAVAVLFVMIGAFMFVTAGGDTEKITSAREKILYAVVAVVVALLSWGIINFIRGAFPGT